MKKKVASAVVLASSAALTAAAHGQITYTEYNSTTANPGQTAWTGVPTPNAANTASESPTTGTAAVNTVPDFTTADGPGASNDLNTISWGQSFEAMVSGPLTNIEIIVTGTPPETFNLGLYNAGSAGTTTALAGAGTVGNTSPLTGQGSAGYTQGTGGGTPGTNSSTFGGNGNGTTSNSGNYINTSTNLLTDGAGITLTGYGTNPNATGQMSAIVDFQFSGVDSVNLVAGEEYVFDLTPTTSSVLFFDRNGTYPASYYPYGEAFKGQESLNGNSQRSFALGVVVATVPEPASASIVALGALGLLARRRNKIT
jgi:hypothetical protein